MGAESCCIQRDTEVHVIQHLNKIKSHTQKKKKEKKPYIFTHLSMTSTQFRQALLTGFLSQFSAWLLKPSLILLKTAQAGDSHLFDLVAAPQKV